jgi:hypothetical protein
VFWTTKLHKKIAAKWREIRSLAGGKQGASDLEDPLTGGTVIEEEECND